jgi:hypothetical protein
MYSKLLPALASALLLLSGCGIASSPKAESVTPMPSATPDLTVSPSATTPQPVAKLSTQSGAKQSVTKQSEAKPSTPVAEVETGAKVETSVKTLPQESEKKPSPVEPQKNAETGDRDTPEDRNRRLTIMRELDKDRLVLKNQNRSITVRGMQAWSGQNGTGNLVYESCDIDGKCLNLQGGTMTCARGTCEMGWTNGDYGYGLTAAMDNPDRPAPSQGYTLTVTQGGKVILEEEGLRSDR